MKKGMADDGLRKMMDEYVSMLENAANALRLEPQSRWQKFKNWLSDSVYGQVLLDLVLVWSLVVLVLAIGRILTRKEIVTWISS